MADIWGKPIMPNKLNHKSQANARVCEENEEKNSCQLKYFAVKGSILETYRRIVTLPIDLNTTTRILQNMKILVL